MKTLHYKTLRGLLKQTSQMSIYKFFSGRIYRSGKGECNFTLAESEKRKTAEKFAEYLLSTKKRRADLVEALMNGRGELDYFQCFYINYSPKYGVYCDNSLSGEAFDYCKRMYLKKYC